MDFRRKILERPHLEGLGSNFILGKRVAMIVAPAGYGKSTLLGMWEDYFQREKHHYSRVNLTSVHKDSNRFKVLVADALSPLISTNQPDSPDKNEIVGSFEQIAMTLEKENTPFTLILDDYHFVDTLENAVLLNGVLKALPSNFSLAIASRQVPKLETNKLKLDGRLTEIGVPELNFSVEETAAFLSEIHTFDFAPDTVSELHHKTEGWAAGLQLAGVSLMQVDEKDAFIRDFSGNDRDIFDYLVEVTVENQSEVLKDFLLRTAHLERFNAEAAASVCEKLTDADSRKLIKCIEHLNLFLIPLDRNRNWYRYHHLFKDFLCRLAFAKDPNLANSVYTKAMRSFCEKELFQEAIDYAFLAGQYEAGAELMEQVYYTIVLQNGFHDTFLAWCEKLPRHILFSHVNLLITQAYALIFSRKTDQALSLLNSIETSNSDAEDVAMAILMIKSIMLDFQNDPQIGVDACHDWFSAKPNANPFFEGSVCCAKAYAALFIHTYAEAEACCIKAKKIADDTASYYIMSWSDAILSLLYLSQGRFGEALALSEQALLESRLQQGNFSYASSLLAVTSALAHAYIGDDVNKAYRRLKNNATFLEDNSTVYLAQEGFIMLARIAASKSEMDEARSWLARGENAARRWSLERMSHALYAERVTLEFQFGDPSVAMHLIEVRQLGVDEEKKPVSGVLSKLYRQSNARIEAYRNAHEGKHKVAMGILSTLARTSRQSGHIQGWVHYNLDAAFIAASANECSVERRLVKQVTDKLGGNEDAIRKLVGIPGHRNSNPDSMAISAQDLQILQSQVSKYKLTKRERELLSGLVRRLTNDELSQELHITVETVKWHLKRLYGKLNVKGRREAVQCILTDLREE